MEIDAPSGDERGRSRAAETPRPARELQGVTVVRVHDGRPEGANRAAQMPQGPRIEPRSPRHLPDRDPVPLNAARQLAAAARDELLLHLAPAVQLAREQANLVLAAAPFAARVDLQDPERGQLGRGPRRPSAWRSSARVKGLRR